MTDKSELRQVLEELEDRLKVAGFTVFTERVVDATYEELPAVQFLVLPNQGVRPVDTGAHVPGELADVRIAVEHIRHDPVDDMLEFADAEKSIRKAIGFRQADRTVRLDGLAHEVRWHKSVPAGYEDQETDTSIAQVQMDVRYHEEE